MPSFAHNPSKQQQKQQQNSGVIIT